jgi:cell division protein FtsI/penicillin-binding protein 2
MRRVGVVAVVVVLVAGVAVLVAKREHGSSRAVISPPVQQVGAYLAAWDKNDYAAMEPMVFQPPTSFVAAHQQMVDGLGVVAAHLTAGPVSLVPGDDTRATAPFSAVLQLGLGMWKYNGTLSLIRLTTTKNGTVLQATRGQPGSTWKVLWEPSTLYPQMRIGLAFARTRTWPQRAPITDETGNVLVGTGPMVQIGVEPGRIANKGQVAAALQQQLGVTPAQLDQDLVGQQPTWFVPIQSVPRDARYQQIRAVLAPIPGIEFRATFGRTGPDASFAPAVLGTTGPITAQQLKQLGAPYTVGDVAGSGGVEEAFERQLAGAPSGAISLVDAKTHTTVAVLQRYAGRAPKPVAITIDPTTQSAANAALATATKPTALVAIDVPSGEVRAVANSPANGFDLALLARVPPGSTFKVITSTAVLASGANATTPITCPPQLTVDGETFHNFEGEGLGTTNFQSAFARSCNNAFIQLVQRAGTARMEQAAAQYGFNVPYTIGLPSFGGSYPAPKDLAELAASSIGQARVVASPLQMASVAAAVARGAWKPPTLVRGVSQPATTATAPINPGIDATLHEFMAAVVQNGTGTAAAVPGHVVYGKTGTAEYGGGPNPPTHAWFIGFTGNTAFAVFVEGGGVGGQAAAPIAARFVSALP